MMPQIKMGETVAVHEGCILAISTHEATDYNNKNRAH